MKPQLGWGDNSPQSHPQPWPGLICVCCRSMLRGGQGQTGHCCSRGPGLASSARGCRPQSRSLQGHRVPPALQHLGLGTLVLWDGGMAFPWLLLSPPHCLFQTHVLGCNT